MISEMLTLIAFLALTAGLIFLGTHFGNKWVDKMLHVLPPYDPSKPLIVPQPRGRNITTNSKLADELQRLCCAETEGKFFDCVTDNIDTILAALRTVEVCRRTVEGGPQS